MPVGPPDARFDGVSFATFVSRDGMINRLEAG